MEFLSPCLSMFLGPRCPRSYSTSSPGYDSWEYDYRPLCVDCNFRESVPKGNKVYLTLELSTSISNYIVLEGILLNKTNFRYRCLEYCCLRFPKFVDPDGQNWEFQVFMWFFGLRDWVVGRSDGFLNDLWMIQSVTQPSSICTWTNNSFVHSRNWFRTCLNTPRHLHWDPRDP